MKRLKKGKGLAFWAVGSVFAIAQADVQQVWLDRYISPGNSAGASAQTMDENGNLYVVGWNTTAQGSAFLTIKYAADGSRVWARTAVGRPGYESYANAVAVDSSGNVVVTGITAQSGTAMDYMTVKYSSEGDLLWIQHYDRNGRRDEAQSVAVDSNHNVYVTGWTATATSLYYDYTTVKYSSDGTLSWVQHYNGPGDGMDEARVVKTDSAGNVYVTGNSYGEDMDFATLKYDSDGDLQWVRHFGATGDSEDYARAMFVDPAGTVYVTGIGNDDFATVKYNTNGDVLWSAVHNGYGGTDEARAITVDEAGNVYITGSSRLGELNYDYLTVKYFANGNFAWEAYYDSPFGRRDIPSGIAVDSRGGVYVTGSSFRGGSRGSDFVTIKYGRNGQQLWLAHYAGPAGDDTPYGVVIDEEGGVYVAGTSWFTYPGRIDSIVVKYGQSCSLAGDVNNDWEVNDADLLDVLFAFSMTGDNLPEDLNSDGIVDDADLLMVLFEFGEMC